MLPIRKIEELSNRFYVRLLVRDVVGALASTVAVFAEHGISISLINQLDDGVEGDDACSVVFLTHRASERDVAAAEAELVGLECVREVANVIRIEDVDAWSEGVFDN